MSKEERIQKLISNFGKYSRRETEKLILENRVKINGQLAGLGDKATIDDVIWIDGKIQKFNLKHEYYMLNKPLGFISSRIDKYGKEVISLIPNLSNRNLFTIGRLDVNTSGLIIVTTDGDLANKVSSPSHEIKKTYLVWINKELNKHDVMALSNGIELENGYITKPAKIKVIKNSDEGVCVKLSIKEGKQNQIKRMIEALGKEKRVVNLKRVKIGNLSLDDLPLGAFKKLTKNDIYDSLGVKL